MTAALNYTPMTTILLSGSLARKFGRRHRRLIDTGQTQEGVQGDECHGDRV